MESQRYAGKRDVYVAGTGSYSPGDPIPFDHIEDVLGKVTAAPPRVMAWIERMRPIMKEMLNIDFYHYALDPSTRQPTEDNVTMSVKSAQQAMAMGGIGPDEIDLLVYGGVVMENICPPTSVLVQDALKIMRCAEYSIHSNCTCTYKGVQLATDMLANGRYRNALIISSQLSSPFLRAEYFNQPLIKQEDMLLRWFLCDGSGATLLTTDPAKAKTGMRVFDTYLESVGVGLEPDMSCRVGGHRLNPLEIHAAGIHHLRQNFHNVAQRAPQLAREAWENMVKATGLDPSRVRHVIINIPTKHMLDMVPKFGSYLDFTKVKLYTKISTRGYPGPCAIFQAMDDLLKEVHLQRGDLIVTTVTESSKWMHAGFALERL
jgi:3-oxoacyl-[acyl-carrier-protein] synthase III